MWHLLKQRIASKLQWIISQKGGSFYYSNVEWDDWKPPSILINAQCDNQLVTFSSFFHPIIPNVFLKSSIVFPKSSVVFPKSSIVFRHRSQFPASVASVTLNTISRVVPTYYCPYDPALPRTATETLQPSTRTFALASVLPFLACKRARSAGETIAFVRCWSIAGGFAAMASGFGITGKKGRCYDVWMDFSDCMSHCAMPAECTSRRDDYFECLHHRKEVRLCFRFPGS